MSEIQPKIAFMFPMAKDGGLDPKLNFSLKKNENLMMRVGVSFINLSRDVNYFPILKLYDENHNELLLPSNGNLALTPPIFSIPVDEIDRAWNTSFLNAKVITKVYKSGLYRLECDLIENLKHPPIDSKSAYFNILVVDDEQC